MLCKSKLGKNTINIHKVGLFVGKNISSIFIFRLNQCVS